MHLARRARRRPSAPVVRAGNSSVERSSPASVKRTAGKAIARRLTTSPIAALRRARPSGISAAPAWRRTGRAPRPSVPPIGAAGVRRETRAALDGDSAARRRTPCASGSTAAPPTPIDGSASPRKPSVADIVDSRRRRASRCSGARPRARVRLGVHASAVVGDADQATAAACRDDLDAACAGIERVLDQFLDHARRTLDHFAGGDLVDHVSESWRMGMGRL